MMSLLIKVNGTTAAVDSIACVFDLTRLFCVLLLGALSTSARAQDVERGRVLYETYCGDCHYERIHWRSPESSKIRTLSDLRDMVARRAPLTKFRFSLDDVEDVVQYLNRTHYKLEK